PTVLSAGARQHRPRAHGKHGHGTIDDQSPDGLFQDQIGLAIRVGLATTGLDQLNRADAARTATRTASPVLYSHPLPHLPPSSAHSLPPRASPHRPPSPDVTRASLSSTCRVYLGKTRHSKRRGPEL